MSEMDCRDSGQTPRPAQSPPASLPKRAICFLYSFSFCRAEVRCSFVSQSFDGIEQRRLARGVIAEEDAHRYREERRDSYGFKRHLRLPMQRLSHQIRPQDPKEHSRSATHQAEHDGFAQELKLDR